MPNHDRNQCLCAYGVAPDRCASLIQRYKSPDNVPLSELDSTNQTIND